MSTAAAAVTLIALICRADPTTGVYDADCGAHVERVADVAECRRRAAEIRSMTPAFIRVVWNECVKERRL